MSAGVMVRWYMHSRLLTDVKLLLEKLDETEFDGHVGISSVLPISAAIPTRGKGMYLNGLEHIGLDGDGQVLAWNRRIGRNGDGLDLAVWSARVRYYRKSMVTYTTSVGSPPYQYLVRPQKPMTHHNLHSSSCPWCVPLHFC